MSFCLKSNVAFFLNLTALKCPPEPSRFCIPKLSFGFEEKNLVLYLLLPQPWTPVDTTK